MRSRTSSPGLLLLLALLRLLFGAADVPAQTAAASPSAPNAVAPQSPVQGAPSGDRAETWPEAFLDDAHLYDVSFVDSRHGWAVGDRGVIWATTDGGQTWLRQDSTVDCRLESIFFLDAERGWAVGGHTVAYSHRAVGVVLRTEDGGAHWKRQSDALLPWLKGIHFRDRANGCAYGWPSTMFPSGLFQTTDGGFHWTPVSGSTPGWVRGEFDRRGNGLLIDRSGKLTQWLGGALRPLGGLGAEMRWPVSALPGEAGDWLACGNQGLLVRSADRGQTWREPTSEPATAADGPAASGAAAGWLREFDWQAIARQGAQVWVAGVPGTRVLHSADGGQSFRAHDTGQRLPIYALDFADEQHGWAVGALGTILHTDDGGQTWQPQHGNDRRLAALGVFARSDSVPWEVVAQLGAADGYRIGLEVFAPWHGHEALIGRVSTATRLHEAAVAAGGVGANLLEGLPLPDARLGYTESQLRERWQDAGAADLEEQLAEYLVRQIRMWQPEMLVSREPEAQWSLKASDAGSPVENGAPREARTDEAIAAEGWELLVRGLALRAAEAASGSDARFQHLDAVGLTAWRVPRITTAARERSARDPNGRGTAAGTTEPRRNLLRDPSLQETRRGGYPVTAQRSVLGRGQSVGSLADRARSHLEQDYRAGEPRWTVRGLPRQGERTAADSGAREPGLASPVESVQAATRRAVESTRESLRQQNQQVQQRKLIESLARGRDTIDAAMAAQLLHLASELEDGPRGELLFQMGSQFFRRGQSDQAFTCWEPFQESLRNHRLAEIARLRMFWYLASEEASMRWRLTGPRAASGEESRVAQAALQVQEQSNAGATVADDDLFDNGAASERTASREATPAQRAVLNESDRDPEESTRRKRLEQLVAFIQSNQTDLYFEPELGYPLAAWQRRSDQEPLALRFWKNQLSARTESSYGSWASRELALAQSAAGADSPATAASWICPAITVRPRLDGILDDDPAWATVKPEQLQRQPKVTSPLVTQVWLAHDDEFLYLAASCPRPAETTAASASPDAPRERDQDLTDDRLEWFLDVDRDGLTHWKFTVDHRGWGRESLQDDLRWNPVWHIARQESPEAWTVEVAIPLRELTKDRVTSGSAWCLGMQRVIPGAELQTWSLAAPLEPRTREFGLLRFE